MNSPLINLFCIVFFLMASDAWAQSPPFVPGQLLIQPAVKSVEEICQDWQWVGGEYTALKPLRKVSQPLNIWLVQFDSSAVRADRLVALMKQDPFIALVQVNHRILPRSIPDDTSFDQQWYHINTGIFGGTPDADMDSELAWAQTTGGVTKQGDTIVIAVLDDGIDINHPDLKDNLWINHHEIPDNNLDDDGNGYVDDYYGWNVKKGNDYIYGGWHGTKVSGVIGARGNNGEGITGINWQIKLMVIKNDFNTDEAKVLEAYSYPLAMRQKFNQTNGAEGAFVVATNASWGIDYASPDEAPLWCMFFDSLGSAGILNCAATSNSGYNVDQYGDLPSTCPSPFLLAVTASDDEDKRNFSAFGSASIDLAAPGELIFTTFKGQNYGSSTGTSLASPQVAGTIGLLYAVNCDDLVHLAKTKPASAALLARKIILESVDPVANLAYETVSGGRLNAGNAVAQTVNNCGSCLTPDFLTASGVTDKQAVLHWFSSGAKDFVCQWRSAGAAQWKSADNVPEPYYLQDLNGCSDYEFRVAAQCTDSLTAFSTVGSFKTDGCCVAPEFLKLEASSVTMATFSWEKVLAAPLYRVRYREKNDPFWQEAVTDTTVVVLSDLIACTTYEVVVQSLCDSVANPPESSVLEFTTAGCTGCVDGNYCEVNASSIFSDLEWIEAIALNGVEVSSGNNGGYAFLNMPFSSVKPDSTYEFSITPGFSGFNYQEYFQLYIDFNHDGDFEDSGELAWQGGPSNTVVTGNFLVPSDAVFGTTRMRVILSFGVSNTSPCPNFISGEVEDYCLEIVPGIVPCLTPVNIDTLSVDAHSALLQWEPLNDATLGYIIRYRATGEPTWLELAATNSQTKLEELDPCQEYEFQIRSLCANSLSNFSNSYYFSTSCVLSTAEISSYQQEPRMEVFPNPFLEMLDVSLTNTPSGILHLRLLDLQGRDIPVTFFLKDPSNRTARLQPLVTLPPGTYLLSCLTEKGKQLTQKVVKLRH